MKPEWFRRVEDEIVKINSQIAELVKERDALDRIRNRADLYPSLAVGTVRRDSHQRAIVEHRITEVLRKARKPLKSKEIFEELDQVHTEVNYSTLRSHLSRMNAKGAIANDGKRPARWSVV